MMPAIFLDRDGVIIENQPAYVRSWDDVHIFPQALAALARVKDSPYKIVLVTNQAGVGRGLIPLQTAEEINQRLLQEIIRAGGRVDGIYMCPHKVEDACSCRKPRPGLLQQAAQELSIDLSQSMMIGDAMTDMQAGLAAGVKRLALVRTGRGAEQMELIHSLDGQPVLVFDSLADALSDLA